LAIEIAMMIALTTARKSTHRRQAKLPILHLLLIKDQVVPMVQSALHLLGKYADAFRELINVTIQSSPKTVKALLRLNSSDDWDFICRQWILSEMPQQRSTMFSVLDSADRLNMTIWGRNISVYMEC
jgi:hypothetical protein